MNNRDILLRWAADAIRKRHADIQNEGRAFACGWVLMLHQPTRDQLMKLATDAHAEADRRFFRGDALHGRFFRAVGDTFDDAFDLGMTVLGAGNRSRLHNEAAHRPTTIDDGDSG